MKNKILLTILCILTALNGILLFTQQSNAKTKSFYTVFPFVTQSGRIGFFDQEDGKIFIYDDNLEKLIAKAQLTSLGDDMEHIDKSSPKASENKTIIVPANQEQ